MIMKKVYDFIIGGITKSPTKASLQFEVRWDIVTWFYNLVFFFFFFLMDYQIQIRMDKRGALSSGSHF